MKKKVIIAIIVAIVVIGGGIGGYVYHSNQVKAENAAICKSKAKDIRMSSIRLIYGLKFITADYITNWNSSIENEVAINMSNKIVSCDDFSKAMSWRWSFYDMVGSFQRVDSCVNKMASDLSLLAKNEESDKQLVEKFEKELEIIEKIKSLTKRPTGTLLEMDYPKAKTKVIKITAKDYVFIDLKDNLNKLSD